MGMFPLGGRGRVVGRVTVPVVPAEPPLNRTERCSACGAGDEQQALRARQAIGGVDLVLCVDYVSCCRRWRAAA